MRKKRKPALRVTAGRGGSAVLRAGWRGNGRSGDFPWTAKKTARSVAVSGPISPGRKVNYLECQSLSRLQRDQEGSETWGSERYLSCPAGLRYLPQQSQVHTVL